MELRELATAVLQARTLEDKLRPAPADLSDDEPGEAVRWPRPERPEAPDR